MNTASDVVAVALAAAVATVNVDAGSRTVARALDNPLLGSLWDGGRLLSHMVPAGGFAGFPMGSVLGELKERKG